MAIMMNYSYYYVQKLKYIIDYCYKSKNSIFQLIPILFLIKSNLILTLINYFFIFLLFRKEAIENLLVADKTVLTNSPQSSGSILIHRFKVDITFLLLLNYYV